MTRSVIWGAALLLACGGGEPGDADAGARDARVRMPDSAVDVGRDSSAQDSGSVDGGRETIDTGAADVGVDAAVDAGVDAGPPTAAGCFAAEFVSPSTTGPDYDAIPDVRIASHCKGTDHQDITGIERVVFVGDSVTVGSPPTATSDWYRVQLATRLATRFGLDRASGPLAGFAWEQWSNVDPTSGQSFRREAGDFASCAKWGARTDDLLRDNSQLEDCFPESSRGERTLVVITIGGNDISNLTQRGLDGVPVDELWMQTREMVSLFRDSVAWLKAPGRFPAGVDVVFANVYEFTDGTGDLDACEGAAFAGFDGEWEDADALEAMVVWINEQYMDIAATTRSDMVFLLETFCGHGFRRDDPTSPCYRGPGAALYFDLTCIHPNARGHTEIADLFMAVVDE